MHRLIHPSHLLLSPSLGGYNVSRIFSPSPSLIWPAEAVESSLSHLSISHLNVNFTCHCIPPGVSALLSSCCGYTHILSCVALHLLPVLVRAPCPLSALQTSLSLDQQVKTTKAKETRRRRRRKHFLCHLLLYLLTPLHQ